MAELTSIPLPGAACALFYASTREGMLPKIIAKMLGVQRQAVEQWEIRALRRKGLIELADQPREITLTLNERIEQVIRRGEADAFEVAYIVGCSPHRALQYLNEAQTNGLIVSTNSLRGSARRWKMAE